LPTVLNRRTIDMIYYIFSLRRLFCAGVTERTGLSFEDIFEAYPNPGRRNSGNNFANPVGGEEPTEREQSRGPSSRERHRHPPAGLGIRLLRGNLASQTAEASFHRVKSHFNL